MNLAELKQKLKQVGIPDNYYAFDDEQDYYDTYVITQDFPSGKWRTVFCDRSRRSCEKIFDTESEACEYFFNWIYAAYEKYKAWLLANPDAQAAGRNESLAQRAKRLWNKYF